MDSIADSATGGDAPTPITGASTDREDEDAGMGLLADGRRRREPQTITRPVPVLIRPAQAATSGTLTRPWVAVAGPVVGPAGYQPTAGAAGAGALRAVGEQRHHPALVLLAVGDRAHPSHRSSSRCVWAASPFRRRPGPRPSRLLWRTVVVHRRGWRQGLTGCPESEAAPRPVRSLSSGGGYRRRDWSAWASIQVRRSARR